MSKQQPTAKVNKVHMLAVRIPLDQLNKLERRAVTQNTNLSKIVRQIFDKID